MKLPAAPLCYRKSLKVKHFTFFWVVLTLNNAINPALPWKRAWGDNIQSHHQSSQLYQARARRSPESSFMEKYNQAGAARGCPLGNSCVTALRRKKFTLSCNKLTFSTWCYVPDGMRWKINPGCPASICWWLHWSTEAGKMMLYCDDTWHSSSWDDKSGDTLFNLLETRIYKRGKKSSSSLSFQNHKLSRGLSRKYRKQRCEARTHALSVRAWRGKINQSHWRYKAAPTGKGVGECYCSPRGFWCIFEASQQWKNRDERWSGLEWLLETVMSLLLQECAGTAPAVCWIEQDNRCWAAGPHVLQFSLTMAGFWASSKVH